MQSPNMNPLLLQVTTAIMTACLAWWLWWDRDDFRPRRRLRRLLHKQKKPSILVIDEEPALAFLSQALRDCGFTVYTTPSPRQSLSLRQESRPEIVLGERSISCDREDMQALATLKAVNPGLRYCLLGEGNPLPAAELERLGTVISIVAPVTLEQLVDTLESLAT